MSNITDRTATVIATEINTLKKQGQTIVFQVFIEIGQRLKEAKELVPHGEWGDWLENNVDYSKSTANNLMRIAEEYGNKQLSMFSGSNLQALGNLDYTKALALTKVPDYEREQFVKDHDVESMSTRELQKAIKEAHERAEKAEGDVKKLLTDNEIYKGELEKARNKQQELEHNLGQTTIDLTKATTDGNLAEVQRLERELKQAGKDLEKAKAKVGQLEEQLKDKPVDVPAADVVERIPEEVTRELEQLRAKAGESERAAKFRARFEGLTTAFNGLLQSLEEVGDHEPETCRKYKDAVIKLIDRMLGSL